VKGFALELLPPDNFTPEYVALPENDLSRYGFAGDQLCVKETFVAFGHRETGFNAMKARDEWHFVDMTIESGFSIGSKAPILMPDGSPERWRPGTHDHRSLCHAPRRASRSR
jgi:hypothetical protein